MHERTQAWKAATWQVHPRLNMPELNSKAVQFAILDSDPVEQFKKKLLLNRERFRQEIDDEKDPSRREMLKRAQMTATWDGLFRAIYGDQVFLLTPDNSKSKELMATRTMVSSNSPAGLKWLTTKVAYVQNMPACWCIPQDVSIGKSAEVELGKTNMFSIERVYHELMG